MTQRTLTRVALSLLPCLVLAGCGDPLGRQAVSGAVTYKGQPLDHGRIEFTPLEGQGTQTGAPVHDGVYAVAAEQGLKPGKYRVRIFSPDAIAAPATRPPGEGPEPPPAKERVADKYNKNSKLGADVVKGGKNVFNFEVD